MRKSLLALWIFLASLCPAPAQMMQDIVNARAPVAVPTYSGPGDIVSSATAWYGLRAYSSGQVAGTTKSVNLRRASDNATCDFDINTSGNLGGTDAGCGTGAGLSLATFATQDATATCTIATTTATCTSGSSVPHAGSTITGSGVTQPCFSTAAGSGTAPSFTIALGGKGGSPCGTIGAGTTLTFTYGLFTTELYDQTGNGWHLTQATAANQPELMPICQNSLPCLFDTNGTQTLTIATIFTITQPYTTSMIAARNKFFTSTLVLWANDSFTVDGSWTNVPNTWSNFGGSAGSVTMSDSATHAAQTLFSGASSFFNIDGTDTSTSLGTNGFTAANGLAIFAQTNGGANANNANLEELGVWPTSFNSTQRGNMCHNQFSYWATAASC